MSALTITFIIVACGALHLTAAWLDSRHNWRLLDWFSGRINNPFKQSVEQQSAQQLKQKDQTIDELKERIQVLEKIVTEPAYELNKKLNQL